MATKNNHNGKEIKKETEELISHLEKDLSAVDQKNDEPEIRSYDPTNIQPVNKVENIDRENNESKCTLIEETNITENSISNSLGIEKDAEKEPNAQGPGSESMMVASYFDDFLSDADVEYL